MSKVKTNDASALFYKILVCIYTGVAIFITIYYIAGEGAAGRAVLGPVSLLFLLLPLLSRKLLKMELSYSMSSAILIFILFAFQLGVAMKMYDIFDWLDNVQHLLSGVLFTLLGICIYHKLNGYENKPDKKLLLQIAFGFCFSMFVAVIWEIYEFSGFILIGHDAQHHLTTGVFDTMEDFIACFIGSIIMAIDYILHVKKGIKTPFSLIADSMYKANSKQSKSFH